MAYRLSKSGWTSLLDSAGERQPYETVGFLIARDKKLTSEQAAITNMP